MDDRIIGRCHAESLGKPFGAMSHDLMYILTAVVRNAAGQFLILKVHGNRIPITESAFYIDDADRKE